MKLELYYAPKTCALVPYVTLTEAGADFEVRPLNFRKRQNFSPEYLKLNPKHKVPALVVTSDKPPSNTASSVTQPCSAATSAGCGPATRTRSPPGSGPSRAATRAHAK